MAKDLGYEGTYVPDKAYELGYDGGTTSSGKSSTSSLTPEQQQIANQLRYDGNSKQEETGKFEASDVGAKDKIVTAPVSYNQPFGVENYGIPSVKLNPVDAKDMAKFILTGTIMAGIGVLSYIGISALTAYVGISTTTAATTSAIGSSITTGYAGTYVNAGINAAVENISLEQYASNLGYTDYDEFKRDLKFDAELNGLIGGMVSATAIISTDIITTSIIDDVVENDIYVPIYKSGDPESTHFVQRYRIDDIEIQINTGHAYNRMHVGGRVNTIGTINEIESTIINDLSKRIECGIVTNGDYEILVNGNIIIYRLFISHALNSYNINYFPPIK